MERTDGPREGRMTKIPFFEGEKHAVLKDLRSVLPAFVENEQW